MTKVCSGMPTPQWKTSDLRWPKFTPEYPPNEKLQISDDQSLLLECPPKMKNFRFEMTKIYSGMPPQWKTLDLEMTWSLLQNAPHNEKLQIWDDQSLLIGIPRPKWKTSDFRWPKFTLEYPPKWKTSDFGDDQSLLHGGNAPQNEKLQIWDDQSLLIGIPTQNEKL